MFRILCVLAICVVVLSNAAILTDVAVMNVAANEDGESISHSELNDLTFAIFEVATQSLSNQKFNVIGVKTVEDRIGDAKRFREICEKNQCSVAAKEADVPYFTESIVILGNGKYKLRVELQNILAEKNTTRRIYQFEAEGSSIQELKSGIKAKASAMFKKIPGAEAISDMSGYDFDNWRNVNIFTEPSGAQFSVYKFPQQNCDIAPCIAKVPGGKHRILAKLNEYDDVDTIVEVKDNNQQIFIKMPPTFGVFDIEPKVSIKPDELSIHINDTPVNTGRAKVDPGWYRIKLSHPCYEDIVIERSIAKGDTLKDNPTLTKQKEGKLNLTTTLETKPVSKPVYVNGKKVGDTPWMGNVPVCATIEVGDWRRQKVDVSIEYNKTAKKTHAMDPKFLDENLFRAIKQGNLPEVQSLISQGADVNARDNSDYTPLHRAVYYNQFDIVKFLVNNDDIEINAEKGDRSTPLNIAVDKGYKDIENFLRYNNAKMNHFEPGSTYVSILLPFVNSATSTYTYGNKEITRQWFNLFIGLEALSEENSMGPDFFLGVGMEGTNLVDILFGIDVKKLFWLWKEKTRIALPISLGLELQNRWSQIDNKVAAEFLEEEVDYLHMWKFKFNIVPAIDLQIFINDKTSLYVGYMYRYTLKDYGWNIYDSDKVPNKYDQYYDSKELIFGVIPGILRFGIKSHILN